MHPRDPTQTLSFSVCAESLQIQGMRENERIRERERERASERERVRVRVRVRVRESERECVSVCLRVSE